MDPNRISIALYNPGTECVDYHWALVLSIGNPGTEPVLIYEIEPNDRDEQRTWVLHRHVDALQANDRVQFLGAIHIPDMNASMPFQELDRYVQPFTANVGPPAGFNVHARPWTCADWVIEAVRGLSEYGLFDLPPSVDSTERLYRRGTAIGLAFQGNRVRPGETGIPIVNLVPPPPPPPARQTNGSGQ